jgi:prepilin-type processing-associated H-X9-DG protein
MNASNHNPKKTRPRWGLMIAIVLVIAGVWAFVKIISILMEPTVIGRDMRADSLYEIARANAAYTQSTTEGRMLTAQPGETAHAVALVLAREEGLNDASFWFIKSDPALAGKTIPKTVLVGDPKNGVLNPDFARLTLSCVFVANMTVTAPVTTTPVAWTRGLQPDGTWSKDSPFGGKGGHIAFLDGHVQWYDKLTVQPDAFGNDNALVNYATGKLTTDIREALPPGAIILPAEPRLPAKTP